MNSIKFHELCDNITDTLVLFKFEHDEIFGGFTTKTWNEEFFYKFDNDAYVFSVSHQKKFNLINGWRIGTVTIHGSLY